MVDVRIGVMVTRLLVALSSHSLPVHPFLIALRLQHRDLFDLLDVACCVVLCCVVLCCVVLS